MRKTGEHHFAHCGGHPRCVTCGCDEDDAFVGGEPCIYEEGEEVEEEDEEEDEEEHCHYCGSGLFDENGDCQKCGL